MFKIPFRIRLKLFIVMCLSVLGVFVISCREKSEKKTFSEIKGFDTPVQGQEIKLPAMAPHDVVHGTAGATQKLGWTLPEGWNIHEGSGMYYAVIKTSSQADADEGSIIVLPGEAGGMQANIERWAGQIGLVISADKMAAFIAGLKKIKTKGGLDLTLVDFNSLVDKTGNSMLVGITKPGEDSYFIKMSGPRENMLKVKDNFSKFCESLDFQ